MNGAEKMIRILEPEIEKKCTEMRRRRHDHLAAMMFGVLALFILTVPALLVYFGMGVLLLLIPAAAAAAAFLLLSPVLFRGGLLHE